MHRKEMTLRSLTYTTWIRQTEVSRRKQQTQQTEPSPCRLRTLQSRALQEGEFSFRLTDEEGNEIDTAKNEENGAVTFKTISFDKPGTYSYTISEVLPKDEDSRTEGVQSSNVTYDEEIIPGVETGDTVEIIPVLFAMVTAISVIIAMSAVMIRRRRK